MGFLQNISLLLRKFAGNSNRFLAKFTICGTISNEGITILSGTLKNLLLLETVILDFSQ